MPSVMKAPGSEIRAYRHICRLCGNSFVPRRHDQEFCQAKCRRDWHRREIERAGRAYRMLMVWARTRGQKITLAEIKKMVHGWIEEDQQKQEE